MMKSRKPGWYVAADQPLLLGLRLYCAAAIAMVASSGPAAAQQGCGQVIVKHGFLSQAQFECDFDYFNEEAIIQAANKCAPGKEVSGSLLKRGMESAIAERNKARDLTAWCATVIKRYPKDVRP